MSSKNPFPTRGAPVTRGSLPGANAKNVGSCGCSSAATTASDEALIVARTAAPVPNAAAQISVRCCSPSTAATAGTTGRGRLGPALGDARRGTLGCHRPCLPAVVPSGRGGHLATCLECVCGAYGEARYPRLSLRRATRRVAVGPRGELCREMPAPSLRPQEPPGAQPLPPRPCSRLTARWSVHATETAPR